ncbi:MAG: hypothetical protein M3545_17110 [Acidobacteriota bacterium]|nr:hypothetical protein [Acidobacteriota bacterium]
METARRFDVFRFLDSLDPRLQGAVTVGARERFAAIEDWHIVGEPDEPGFRSYPASAFNDPAVTFGIRYEHGNVPVSFFRDTSGVVHLRGELVRVEQGQNHYGSNGFPPFALPPGYRGPGGGTSYFSVAGSRASRATQPPRFSGEAPREYDPPLAEIYQADTFTVADRGLVNIYDGLPAGGSIFLDGIRFLAAPVNRERYITDDARPAFGY